MWAGEPNRSDSDEIPDQIPLLRCIHVCPDGAVPDIEEDLHRFQDLVQSERWGWIEGQNPVGGAAREPEEASRNAAGYRPHRIRVESRRVVKHGTENGERYADRVDGEHDGAIHLANGSQPGLDGGDAPSIPLRVDDDSRIVQGLCNSVAVGSDDDDNGIAAGFREQVGLVSGEGSPAGCHKEGLG